MYLRFPSMTSIRSSTVASSRNSTYNEIQHQISTLFLQNKSTKSKRGLYIKRKKMKNACRRIENYILNISDMLLVPILMEEQIIL